MTDCELIVCEHASWLMHESWRLMYQRLPWSPAPSKRRKARAERRRRNRSRR